MKVTISFLHLEHTDALDERIRSKSLKLKKYLDGNINVKWSCYVKEKTHYAEVSFSGPNFNHHASAGSESLYKSIDEVIHKAEKQLSKQKDKLKNRRNKHGKEELIILDPENAWTDHEEEFYKKVP